MAREIIKIGIGQTTDQTVGIEDSSSNIEVDRLKQGYRRNNFRNNSRGYSRQDSRGEYRNNNNRNDSYNRGRNRSIERSFLGNYGGNRTRSTSNSILRSGSRASTNRDRIRCYNCKEYDHLRGTVPLLEKKEK